MTYAARIQSTSTDPAALDALRLELIVATDPTMLDALWMYAPTVPADAPSWKVVVHPAPGLTRDAEFALAGDVRWYDEPPSADIPCWFTYDRDCFVEIGIPGSTHPYFVRRTQSSFGRWRVRRSPQPSQRP